MKRKLIAVAAIVLLLGARATAHRLDEYLQAALVSVEKDRVEVSLRLVPGVAVSAAVLASIDSNGDGNLSETEKRAYAERVLGDLSLSVDGTPLKPKLVAMNFSPAEQMREGLGEIHVDFTADLPSGGRERKLVLKNHHQTQMAAYLVNCLVPSDPEIQIVAQKRNERQSFYELDYVQSGKRADVTVMNWSEHRGVWVAGVMFLASVVCWFYATRLT
jgi:hypothetical protein